jgi:hypothetical protein
MGLLTDLTLAYEILADDPIERGIHYGQSILNILSQKAQVPMAAVPREQVIAQVTETLAPSRPIERSLRPSLQSPAPRRDFINYQSRPLVARTRTGYSQRQLVGAL